MTFSLRAQLFCVVRGTCGLIFGGYDIWLAFHKVFPWEITVRSKGEHQFTSGREDFFPLLMFSKWYLCWIFAIRNFFGAWSVSGIGNTKVSFASWWSLMMGFLPRWWASTFVDLWGVTQAVMLLWVRTGSFWGKFKLVPLLEMVGDFRFI